MFSFSIETHCKETLKLLPSSPFLQPLEVSGLKIVLANRTQGKWWCPCPELRTHGASLSFICFLGILFLTCGQALLLLLLLLSRFSRVQLCATPETAAHQSPPSLGFSRQEHWSGLPFPSPVHESEVAQSCPTLCNPMDHSLPGSSIHGIFQKRVLEWGAITFSSHPRWGSSRLTSPQST